MTNKTDLLDSNKILPFIKKEPSSFPALAQDRPYFAKDLKFFLETKTWHGVPARKVPICKKVFYFGFTYVWYNFRRRGNRQIQKKFVYYVVVRMNGVCYILKINTCKKARNSGSRDWDLPSVFTTIYTVYK